jgi:hypothetical protein
MTPKQIAAFERVPNDRRAALAQTLTQELNERGDEFVERLAFEKAVSRDIARREKPARDRAWEDQVRAKSESLRKHAWATNKALVDLIDLLNRSRPEGATLYPIEDIESAHRAILRTPRLFDATVIVDQRVAHEREGEP